MSPLFTTYTSGKADLVRFIDETAILPMKQPTTA
jgi:hypothetical protein